MRYALGNMALLSLFAMLPYPFGPLSGQGSGLVEWVFRRIHPDGRQFLEGNALLTRESHKMIRAKMADPNLKDHRDLLALFMNAQVTVHERTLGAVRLRAESLPWGSCAVR